MIQDAAFTRRSLLAATLALPGCATTLKPTTAKPPAFIRASLAPLRMTMDRLTHITVCLRPFRAAGPRLDVETIGNKRVVHNYGHGGSGWSLSWGSAAITARNAMEGGGTEIAVIGCGALGLTTAITLQRAGASVTIYAKDRLPQSRSARATGIWSPDSRIAASEAVSPQFPALWEAITRRSFAEHQSYVGLPGNPVVWTDNYFLSDTPRRPAFEPRPGTPEPPGAIHFAHYGRSRIPDLTSGSNDILPQNHPFPTIRATHNVQMQFNITALADRLMAEFLGNGGIFIPADFASPAEFLRIAQPVIVNCTGYGARALMRDETIVPVRGQIGWLAAQPEVTYGLFYRSVSIVPRPEGIVVQYVGESEMYGVGNTDETPDQGETARAVATVAPLFAAA